MLSEVIPRSGNDRGVPNGQPMVARLTCVTSRANPAYKVCAACGCHTLADCGHLGVTMVIHSDRGATLLLLALLPVLGKYPFILAMGTLKGKYFLFIFSLLLSLLDQTEARHGLCA